MKLMLFCHIRGDGLFITGLNFTARAKFEFYNRLDVTNRFPCMLTFCVYTILANMTHHKNHSYTIKHNTTHDEVQMKPFHK